MRRADFLASYRVDPEKGEDPCGPGPAVAGCSASEPACALRPSPRPDPVRRDRLLRALSTTAADVPLILVTGPAGYGKTTVLRQWAAEDQRLFAWVQLDERDNNPVRLLRSIALGLHRIRPLSYAVWRALESTEPADLAVALPRLLTTVAGASAPWVLVLDDMHVLRAGADPDVIAAFVNGLPHGCHVVVAGRSQLGVKLGGLRSQGRCAEFGTRELAFTADEVRAVLDTAGVHPTGEAVDDLLRRTDGWPAGVYLAARSGWGGCDTGTVAEEFSGSTTAILDYFREEVLHGEPAEVVEFLMRTAPLSRLSGPLCDAVLGSADSAARLADLNRRSLFLVPLDAHGTWYRYHPLFREMLLAKLRCLEPAHEERTHRRAAWWYERQRQCEPAIAHALAGGDSVTAARVVARNAPSYVNTGRVQTVRAWLAALTTDAVADHPPLAVAGGWVWALAGGTARAQECLHAAERAARAETGRRGPDGDTADGTGELASAVARLRAALAPDGVEQMLADAREALDREPPGSTCYPLTCLLLGAAHLLGGDSDAAAGALERAAHLGREQLRPAASLALALLSLSAAEREDWTTADSYAVEAAELMHAGELSEYPSSIPVYVAQARVALHRRDIQEAWHNAGKAMLLYAEPSPAAFPWLAAHMGIALGGILLGLDDHPAAQRKVAEARRHLARLSTNGVLGHQHERLAEKVARQGERSPASAMALTAAEVRVLQLLPTHLTLSEIADALFLSRNTVKTQVASVYAKLLASTRAEAVRTARSRGLVA